MFRTTQRRGDERQTSTEQPRQAARAIYRLPTQALLQHGDLASDEQGRGYIEALVMGAAIDVRVEWDGNAARPGRFDVRVGASAWQACELIDPGDLNDVVSLDAQRAGTVFLARFQRTPAHAPVRAGVKALVRTGAGGGNPH